MLLLLLLLLVKVAADRLAPAKHGRVAEVHCWADEGHTQGRPAELAAVAQQAQGRERQVAACRVTTWAEAA
jgi:hypothetical protein